jgi:hypothetical protein
MRLLKFNDFIKESTDTKENIITWENLDKYGVPEKIKMMMKEWSVIKKSPYSDSFYSSTDISWNHKPEGSYRVSDHWNFTTKSHGRLKKTL